MAWQLQEAKARFSQLVRKAIEEGPQAVTRHGEEVVVVISAEEFRRMQKKPSLKETLMSGPDGDLDLPPRRFEPREVEF